MRRNLKFLEKTCCVVLHGALVMGLSGSMYGQERATPFSLTIETPKPFVTGSDMFVNIKQTNTSQSPVSCTSFEAGGLTDVGLNYEVRKKDGTSLKERENAYDYASSIKQCELSPGESLTRRYLISWLFDLNAPGEYSLQVSRVIDPTHAVKSNVVPIVVVPRE